MSDRRFRWYRFVYATFYRLGLTVWERKSPPADLVALVEGPSPLPAGRALDIGSGTGGDSIYLARRDWEVTGVDMVPRALAIARRRAAAAGVSVRFLQGDATRLEELGLPSDHTLLLDFGCFHTLPEDRREPYVRSVSGVAAPGATFLLVGFSRPPKLAPMRAGLTAGEVRERFGGSWELLSADPLPPDTLQVGSGRGDLFEAWRYLLRRL